MSLFKNILIIATFLGISLLFSSSVVFANDVIMATSEDINEFDRMLEQAPPPRERGKRPGALNGKDKMHKGPRKNQVDGQESTEGNIQKPRRNPRRQFEGSEQNRESRGPRGNNRQRQRRGGFEDREHHKPPLGGGGEPPPPPPGG